MRLGEPTNDADLLVAVEEARLRRLEKRRGFETLWWNNIALLTGDHYTEWNPLKGEIIQRMPTEGKTRIVINHALAVARTELSKLMKSKPVMTVMAQSDEPDDIATTKVALIALDACEWKFNLPKLRKNALWWMIPTGMAAIYVGWDPTNARDGKAEYTIDPNTNEPVFDTDRIDAIRALVNEGTLDEMPNEQFPLGDMDYKVYTAFQLLPDETATEFRELKDLITTDVVDVDEAKNIWGSKANHLIPEKTYLGTIERRMIEKLNVGSLVQTPTDNAVNVHTWWLIPGRYGNGYLKDGLMVRWCQNKIIELARPFPFTDHRIPFAFFQHIPGTVAIWPDSTLTHIRGLNLEVDKTASQLVETKDHMANPQWRVATQQQIVGKIKNKAGGIIRYVHVNNIPPPEPITGIMMPAQVEDLFGLLRSSILEISGQSEPTRGNMPHNVRSGVQIAYLQEEDDSKIAPTVDELEFAVAFMASLTLSRMGQFYSSDRLIRVYRRNGIFDVRKFKGANLKGNTDVIPVPGSGSVKSKAARQQYILELAQLGLMTDPHQIMEALEVGQGEPSDLEMDYSQAERENSTMMYGLKGGAYGTLLGKREDGQTGPAAPPVKKWHNHKVHLERHYAFMKQMEFDQMSIKEPQIPRLFDEHTAMHEQIIQEEQRAQMEMLQAMKGAPDGPPGSASPTGRSQRTVDQMNVPDTIGGGQVDIRSQGMTQ